MREKLKELDLRITELSNYLGMSRPTLYKYMHHYENRTYKDIDSIVLEVFRFISKKTTKSKLQVIQFIIQSHKHQQGLSRTLIEDIEFIVFNQKREDELVELIKLFKMEDSRSIINEIVKTYVKGEQK